MTSNHINMFAKAKEIQEGWKPEVGDMAYDTLYGYPARITEILFDRFALQGGQGPPQKRCIFLPSIEQMAEMVANPLRKQHKDRALLDYFYTWVSTEVKPNQGWPMNILWLAYVMWKLHGFTWSEEKGEWINANT